MEKFNEFEYITTVRSTDFVLRDHLVQRTNIMPGVVFLDMVCRLLKLENVPPETIELKDIVFKEAVAVSDDVEKTIQITLERPANSTDNYGVIKATSRHSKDNRPISSCATENFRCKILFDKAPATKRIDIEALKSNALRIADLDEAYAQVRDMNITHLEFMKAIGNIYLGKDYALAQAELSEIARSSSGSFYIHPVFLDVSSIVSFFINSDGKKRKTPFIPIFIRSFEPVKELHDRCFIHVEKRRQRLKSNDIVYMDMELYNENGEIAASIVNMATKRIRSEEMIRRLVAFSSDMRHPTDFSPFSRHEQEKNEPPGSFESESQGDCASEPSEDALVLFCENELRRMIGEITNKPPEAIAVDEGFYNLGLESTHLLQIAGDLEARIGKELYPTLLFEYPTILELAKYLTANHKNGFTEGPNEFKSEIGSTRGEHIIEFPVEKSEKSGLATDKETDIAVIGLAGKYPFAPDIRKLWENVLAVRDCIVKVPADRWDIDFHLGGNMDDENAIRCKWGGFIEDAETFDPLFFGISPKEAKRLDPQIRLILQTAWHAVEDAGYTRKKLTQNVVGVYCGVMNDDFTWVASEKFAKTGAYESPGSYAHDIANRISYSMDFRGPSLTVETACSSSLTAIHLARTAIIGNECDLALAGGVNLCIHPSKYLMLSGIQILSPEGKEKTFDESADGYVPGEGVGMVLLKPLSKAVADRDHIYGAIKGSSINHSGTGSGYMVPNIKPLSIAAEKAIMQSGIDPEQISYVETHGTGTVLGDPVEIKALASAFERYTGKKGFCALGSKANLGHMESASGICSLTKVLMAMKNGKIPACANIGNVNPSIELKNSPFYIPDTDLPWAPARGPRAAAVNSFGIGGSNCFVVVEEYCSEKVESREEEVPRLLVLSAKNKERLREYAENMSGFLKKHGLEENKRKRGYLSDLAFTLQVGREAMRERLAIPFASLDQLIELLDEFVADDCEDRAIFRGSIQPGTSPDKKGDKEKVNRLVEDGNLLELGKLWVSGIFVPWEKLHEKNRPRRVSVPCYPFEKRICKMADTVEKSTNSAIPAETEKSEKRHDSLYVECVWRQSRLKTISRDPERQEAILLFDAGKSSSISNELRKQLPSSHSSPIVRIEPGKAFGEIGDNEFTIDPENEKDYEKLMDALVERDLFPGSAIHAWSFFPVSEDSDEPSIHLQRSIYSVIYLARTLLFRKPGHANRILYLCTGNNPYHSAVSALFGSISLETPKIQGKIVEIENTSLLETALKEFHAENDSIHVKYDANYCRKIMRLESFSPPEIPSPVRKDKAGNLKDGGVYLITGGAGGLGRIIAEHISNRVEAILILSGRKELSEKEISDISGRKSKIIYLRCDLSVREETFKLIQTIKQRYKTIDGIVHCAGAIRDSLLINKNRRDIDVVLGPKIQGTVWLDEATKDAPLDFFVFFSSISSVLGNIGQCDYAYANSFMDHYAESREIRRAKGERYGKTVSINWPLWKNGTMNVDRETRAKAKRKFGLEAIEDALGTEAFELALAMDKPRFMVLGGDPEKIRRVFDISRSGCKNDRAIDIPENKDLLSVMEKDIVDMVCRILEIEREDIDLYENISEYGFDSISLTRFAGMINKQFDLEITPDIFFEHDSIGSLLKCLASRHSERFEGHYRGFRLQENKKKSVDTAPPRTRVIGKGSGIQNCGRQSPHEPVAIVGIGGKMPRSENLDIFWRHLEQGDDLITEIPQERWNWREIYGDPAKEPGKTLAKWGGFMPEIDKFDAVFFGISPREAELMDPQQRIFLETVWHTLEDAGYRASDLWGKDVGVFVGASTHDYADMLLYAGTGIAAHTSTGMANSMIANRVSYCFNFRGPSEPVDTACSSSLLAILRAASYVREKKGRLAIAGGVNAMLSPMLNIAFGSAGMLCDDGRCKTFDAKANGYVRGEGVGALLLKSLERAEADNDYIYAVIRGGAVNHGGRAASLTAPNTEAQADLLETAYASAGIHPASISYLETHGTGTKLGDPVEINALKKFVANFNCPEDRNLPEKIECALGSVKTNIGHLEAAAGIASVIKVLLSMKHGKIPAHLHLGETNPYIELEGTGFYLNRKTRPWKALAGLNGKRIPRRAGISSFGFGGSNAHVIIEEYPQPEKSLDVREEQLIVLSAKNRERLVSSAARLGAFLEKEKDSLSLADVAFTLQTGREPMEERIAFAAMTIEEVSRKLKRYCENTDTRDQGFYAGRARKNRIPSLSSADKEEIGNGAKDIDNLHKLASAWTGGKEIDWKLIRGNSDCRRIPLPGYPFERKRYWIPVTEPVHSFGKPYRADTLHPMIDTSASTPAGQCFEKTVLVDEYYVKDHLIRGEKVLPAVFSLEMARAAGELAYKDKRVSKLKGVVWNRLVTFGNKSRTIKISLNPDRDHVGFDISFEGENGANMSFSTGSIVFADEDIVDSEHLDIDEIINRCRSRKSREECYDFFRSRGVNYGSGFKAIETLYLNGNEALSKLACPESEEYNLDGCSINPSIMDGALQTVAGIMEKHGKIEEKELLVPFSMEEMVIAGPLPAHCYAHAAISEPAGAGNGLTCDIRLGDESGGVLVRIRGISFRPVKSLDYTVSAVKQKKIAGKPSSPKNKLEMEKETGEIERRLLRLAGDILKVDEKEISIYEDLGDYGFDSFLFTTLANRMNEDFGLEATPALFYEYPDIHSLAAFVLDEQKDSFIHNNRESPTKAESSEKGASETENNGGEQRFSPARDYRKKNGSSADSPIAIVGISGIMPGSDDLETFWRHLDQGRSLIGNIPRDRHWLLPDGPIKLPESEFVKHGGFMNRIDEFDSELFKISPREAEWMDPQQRLLLETVWRAVADAGYKPRDLFGSRIGVFVGASSADYYEIANMSSLEPDGLLATGSAHAVLANRISSCFNFTGPSETVDTACSSSSVAIHRAISSICLGECEAAVAGGVNVLLSPSKFIMFGKLGLLSRDGTVKTFDEDADGYVRGEGVGAILLKPLRLAEKDKDHIHAVIRGSAVNHGGKGRSLTSPNPSVQAEMLFDLYERTGVDPGTVGYIETQGTGTAIGDPIEINAFKKAFSSLFSSRNREMPRKKCCGLGSVKPNIGHLESASGMAALFKVILSMIHKKLPATAHFKKLNPYIEIDDTPFYIVDKTLEWKAPKDDNGQTLPRRAGINAFGFGGTNAHIILEEYLPAKPFSKEHKVLEFPAARLFLFSAGNNEKLYDYLFSMKVFLENAEYLSMADIAFTLACGREAMPARMAIIANHSKELMEKIQTALRGKELGHDIISSESCRTYRSNPNSDTNDENLLEKHVREKNARELAKIWVAGTDIDWMFLHENNDGKRVSLPCQPFEKKRSWLPLQEVRAPEFESLTNAGRFVSEKNGDSSKDSIGKNLVFWIAELLKTSVGIIDGNVHLPDYGFNSLTGMRLINRIQEFYDVRLPVKELFNRTTINKIADYVAQKVEKKESLEQSFDVSRKKVSGLPGNKKMSDKIRGNAQKNGVQKEMFLEAILHELAEGGITPRQAIEIEEKFAE